MAPPSIKELQCHVSKAADADHRDTIGRLNAELDQWIKDGDAATKQRAGTCQIKSLRQLDDTCCLGPDFIGKTAVMGDNS